ncbi:hypothetical protein ACS0TY_009068 [Phlomoides rotata]
MQKTMCTCFGSSQNEAQKRASQDESISFSVSPQLKDVVVRVVHAGGRIEMYENAMPASKLIHKYPGMCIARPDVFKHPNESVLSGDDILVPGNKYYVVRSTTVEKLKRRQTRKGRKNESANGDEPVSSSDDHHFEEDVSGSGDFFVSRDEWSILRKQMKEEEEKKKKQFVPPIQRPKMWKEDWEPSLTSIKEISL